MQQLPAVGCCGFLGAVELLRESEIQLAAWNVAGNLCLGFAAVWLSLVVTKAIVS